MTSSPWGEAWNEENRHETHGFAFGAGDIRGAYIGLHYCHP